MKLILSGDNELTQEWTDRSDTGVGEPFQFRFTKVEPHKISLQYQDEQKIVGITKTIAPAILASTLRQTLKTLNTLTIAIS